MTASGELLKKIDPERYFDQFISEQVYPDGRGISQFRPFSIKQSVDKKAYGSAFVQQGGATVSCTCNVSVAPNSDEPPILYEMNWLECVPKKTVEEAELHLRRILANNYLLNADSLKIDNTPSTSSSNYSFDLRFTLHLDIVAICTDGSLTDAVLTAVQAAILDINLPTVEYMGSAVLEDIDGNGVDDIPLEFDINKLRITRENKLGCVKRLQLKDFLVYTPLLLYAGSFNHGNSVILCDPSSELCSLIKNRYEVISGSDGALYALTFTSAIPFQNAMLEEIVQLARRRHNNITKCIEKYQKSLQLF